ncbi:TraR/DksA family transcriptional regulator [Herbaspirillum frisingense]|uniref:TraR/DksA family transcriptional regulator n=1 Tax=Herbaspirillum frisingense TaxID=92645 RepID=UPI001F2BC361|nr:TraR/DksA C4-type zinc finger protein [Herbaspirillum frisingense]UIN23745.1 TraR/DksA family transcriptional regulator [Herbaspirillum frisingense]
MRHLSTTQLIRLRSLLDEAETSLRQRMRTDDFADDEQSDRLGIQQVMSDQELHELLDITEARSRLTDNSYGLCVDCGAEIEVERLLAYPTAKRCLACQQQHERGRTRLNA